MGQGGAVWGGKTNCKKSRETVPLSSSLLNIPTYLDTVALLGEGLSVLDDELHVRLDDRAHPDEMQLYPVVSGQDAAQKSRPL